MADIKVRINVNTLTDHFIGYRNYLQAATEFVVITYTPITLGEQIVIIPIEGNLYCCDKGIEYNGYVIASCQSQADTTGNGIPDAATVWTHEVDQITDSCGNYTLTCNEIQVLGINIDTQSSKCLPYGTYNLDIKTVDPVDTIQAAIATIQFGDPDGSTLAVTVVSGGRYTAVPVINLPTGPSCDVDPVLTLVMGSGEIDLTEVYCDAFNITSDETVLTLELNEQIHVCCDDARIINLPQGIGFTRDENCHCSSCVEGSIAVPVSTTAPTGEGRITYETCWDDTTDTAVDITTVSRDVVPGDSFTLGRIIEGSLIMEQGTLDPPMTFTITNT